MHKKILLIGKQSYISNSFEKWVSDNSINYDIDSISVRNNDWKELSFSEYDVVIHLAAIVHKREKKMHKEKYFMVNSNLAEEVAIKARLDGVKHFIFMSTMAVYGSEGELKSENIITAETKEKPKSYYGQSKLQGEKKLIRLQTTDFALLIMRPPMIYGEDSPGNYIKLKKLAKLIPIFPLIDNKRSVLHIERLCEVIFQCVEQKETGLVLPQDDNYFNTSSFVKKESEYYGKSLYLSKLLGWIIKNVFYRIKIMKKIFGNLAYEKVDF